MISLLAAAVLATASPDWVRVVSSFEKIRPGAPFSGASEAKLSAARGECEAFQLRVREGSKQVKVSASAAGSVTPRLYVERFIDVQKPSNGEGATGFWPDALVPLTDAQALQSTAKVPLVLYAEYCVPTSAKPGTFSGTVRVKSDGRADAVIPVKLEVQPFAIPATSSLPNTFGISIYSVAKGHGIDAATDEARSLLGEYAKSALSHRISLHGMGIDPLPVRFGKDGNAEIDFRQYDAEVGPFLSGTALPSGAKWTTAEVRDAPKLDSDEKKAAYYAAIRDHFREKNWKQTLFFYAKDEPRPADFPVVLSQSKTVRRAGGIPVLVTSALNDTLLPATDILAPVMNCFFRRNVEPTCANIQPVPELRASVGSRRIWWYQSCMSHGCEDEPIAKAGLEKSFEGWASYMVDHATTRNRAMGPLAYVNGVQGELYFATVHAYHQPDPWTSVYAFGGNGDGTLFYPGTPSRLGVSKHMPVESLRLKAIRDGLEDYEYFALLERLGDKETAMKAAKSIVPTGYSIEPSPAAWQAMREKVGAAIKARWKKSEYARR